MAVTTNQWAAGVSRLPGHAPGARDGAAPTAERRVRAGHVSKSSLRLREQAAVKELAAYTSHSPDTLVPAHDLQSCAGLRRRAGAYLREGTTNMANTASAKREQREADHTWRTPPTDEVRGYMRDQLSPT